MPAQDWVQAVAAVIDRQGVVRGTAFFVGQDVALTCQHVLAAAGQDGAAELRTSGSQDSESIIEYDSDVDLDMALIRVPLRVDRHWLSLKTEIDLSSKSIHSHGFPWDHQRGYPDGFPMDPATVSGHTTLIWGGQPVKLLVLTGSRVQKGMSGAPAVVERENNSVVGILRFSERGDARALAIPTEVVTRRWPGLLVDRENKAPSYSELTHTTPEALALTAWKEFDPRFFHCVVVDSEFSVNKRAGGSLATSDSLITVFRDLLASPNASILWDSFRSAWQGRQLVKNLKPRPLPEKYSRSNIKVASFSILDAFASPSSLDLAARLLVEADLALFDVTCFEPGVMLLLGIRAATRRGVTIASHGNGWREGEPLSRPFNLSDISLSSHTPADVLVGDDPRSSRMLERLRTGFNQLAQKPYYQDLPVYDALRQIGPQESAWTSIPLEREVLFLCSYDAKYFPIWRHIRGLLKDSLFEAEIQTNVSRLQDVATPQLVSQSLYERIRRCAGCVADWTGASPSTFFELGVRIAVSPWSVVQVASEEWFRVAIGDGSQARQLKLMQHLLNPLLYRNNDDQNIGRRIAELLMEFRSQISGSTGHRLRHVVASAVGNTEVSLPGVAEQLKEEADTLNHPNRVRDNIPQALYYEVSSIKKDQERASLERRLGAWLYLEYRVHAGDLTDSDHRKQLWRELGESAAADLFLSSDSSDQILAHEISERLKNELIRGVTLQRRQGDALKNAGESDEAKKAYQIGLAMLDEELAKRKWHDTERKNSSDLADLLGARGGMLRRLGRVHDALSSYREGGELEKVYKLPVTYNRANRIKLALIAGEATLAILQDEMREVRDVLKVRLHGDERAADDAWPWADLGDVLLLLGNNEEAEEAYRTFATKASSESPMTTVTVLREIVDAVRSHGDPDAERLATAVAKIEQIFDVA